MLAPLIDDQNRELQDIEAWIESADALRLLLVCSYGRLMSLE